MSVTISPVRSRSELRSFITMVWSIYNGDPDWAPPVIADRQKLLNREKNPFYRHAEMELFLARREGKIVGRIAAIVNHLHNSTHNDKVGFFGFFETIDDQEVADALLGAAERWLAGHGMAAMRGPVNPSMNDEAGLLVDGFDDPPQVLMTYNPKYYSRVIETYGLTKVKDLNAYRLRAETFITPKLERVVERVRQRSGATIRTVNFSPKSAFLKDVEILKRVYNAAWELNWGFVKMTDEEFDFLAKDLKQVAERKLTLIAEINGEPVGVAIALPDINQALMYNRNGSLLGAAYSLLFRKKKITRGRILILGVVPGFQGHGLDALLYYEIGTRMVRGEGYTEGEASWVLEDNVMMNRSAKLLNGERYKTYRLYEKTMNKN